MTNATSQHDTDAQLAEIARKTLGFKTLETRNAGDLDFREVPVWLVAKALREAYEAGRNAR